MRGSRGETGGPDPHPGKSQTYKNIGFLKTTGPDHLKNYKVPSQDSMLGHHGHGSKIPFEIAFSWQADDGPILVVFGFSLFS